MTKRNQIIVAAVAFAILWCLGFDMSPLYAAPIIIGNVTSLAERASIVQREMSQTVARFRPEKARTLATFQQGTRSKTARLAGLQIGYWKDHAHGQSWYSPLAGDTSFRKSTKQKTGAMYLGVVFRNMNFYMESHIMKDMSRGFIPDSYIKERQRRISTHMMKKNWAAIGDGTGAIASVASASGSTITATDCNASAARGTTKGVFRMKVSDSTDPVLYDCVNPATDGVVATFYVTAKPTYKTATVTFTVGNAAAMNVSTYKICESGSWKKEMNGIAGLISDSTSRILQGADCSVDEFLVNPAIDAGAATPTPTMINAAKGLMLTRVNGDGTDDFGYLAHITPTNYRILAAYGMVTQTRTYFTNDNNKATKTYGLPNVYQDGDTTWVCDADYEDNFIDFREKGPYFEYVQKEFGLYDDGSGSRKQWQGANAAGSTNSYENYNEACNLGWDSAGADGNGDEGGSPNTAVSIKNIAVSVTSSSTIQAIAGI